MDLTSPYTHLFTAARFATAKRWERPNAHQLMHGSTKCGRLCRGGSFHVPTWLEHLAKRESVSGGEEHLNLWTE